MSESIGELLRKTRIEKKLSLEKAAQALHIRVKYLEALEEDRRDLLPSLVQAKGFLRLYAGLLDLPLQPMLERWEGRELSPAPPSVEPARETQAQQPDSPELPAPMQSDLEPEAVPVLTKPVETQSSRTFSEIGQTLFERRIALNLSLADVERFTHVRQHYLKALEEGRLNDLPSTVQGRGMLNNYARFLDLDADELLSAFADVLQTRRAERLTSLPASMPSRTTSAAAGKKSAPKRASAGNTWTRLITPDLVIVGSVIIGLLLFAIWSASQVASRQQQPGQSTPLSIADVLLSSTPLPQLNTTTPSLAPNLGTRQPQTAVSTQAGGATLALTRNAPITGSGALQIYIVATQRTYLRVTADNRIIFDERLVPGNAYAFAGNRTIEVLISNAAGVQIFYNQKDLGNLGVLGEVKRMLFTSEGVITPTLAFSATPSRTPVPSSTPRPSPTLPTATITPFIP